MGCQSLGVTNGNPAGYFFWEYGRRVVVKRTTEKKTYLNPVIRARAHKSIRSRQVENYPQKARLCYGPESALYVKDEVSLNYLYRNHYCMTRRLGWILWRSHTNLPRDCETIGITDVAQTKAHPLASLQLWKSSEATSKTQMCSSQAASVHRIQRQSLHSLGHWPREVCCSRILYRKGKGRSKVTIE